MPPATTYGQRPRWAGLYDSIVASGTDLRGRLQELQQAAHAGANPADVDTVLAALFAVHEQDKQAHPESPSRTSG
jgi:hypothetical protein